MKTLDWIGWTGPRALDGGTKCWINWGAGCLRRCPIWGKRLESGVGRVSWPRGCGGVVGGCGCQGCLVEVGKGCMKNGMRGEAVLWW